MMRIQCATRNIVVFRTHTSESRSIFIIPIFLIGSLVSGTAACGNARKEEKEICIHQQTRPVRLLKI